MLAQDLAIFVDSVMNYFTTTTNQGPKVATPYLVKDIDDHIEDYTGVITVSGEKQGLVFFSAPKRMIGHILHGMGLMATQKDMQLDLVGEICNIITGNVRRHLGENFNITTPQVHSGPLRGSDPKDFAGIYIVPIQWHNLEAKLIINLAD